MFPIIKKIEQKKKVAQPKLLHHLLTIEMFF